MNQNQVEHADQNYQTESSKEEKELINLLMDTNYLTDGEKRYMKREIEKKSYNNIQYAVITCEHNLHSMTLPIDPDFENWKKMASKLAKICERKKQIQNGLSEGTEQEKSTTSSGA